MLTLSYKAKRKHAELIKRCTSFPGGDNKFMPISRFSETESANWSATSNWNQFQGKVLQKHQWELTCCLQCAPETLCTYGQIQTPNSGPFFSTELLFLLAFRFLYRVLKAIMLGSICPIYPAPTWLQRSFRQWVWTHECWHGDYLPCEERFNQINLWEIPSASSLQSPTAKDRHNLTAYSMRPPPRRKLSRSPGCLILFSSLGLAPLQCPPSASEKG